nr:hypothetical protein [uncultured Blautia sp.]
MNELLNDNYILSSREFLTLAFLTGIQKISLPVQNKPQPLDEKETYQLLFQLYQKKVLCWKDNGQYTLTVGLKEIFSQIKTATQELRIYYPGKKSPVQCFGDRNIVVTELSENDRDSLRVCKLSPVDFFLKMQEKKVFPVQKISDKKEFLQKESLSKESLQKENPELWETLLQKYRNLLLTHHENTENLFELFDTDPAIRSFVIIYDRKIQQEKGFLLLLNNGIHNIMLYLENNNMTAEYYSEKILREILLPANTKGGV